MNRKFNSNQNIHGFSIIELLIVIIVIGILATITAVAYNGSQQTARTAKYHTDALSISKKSEISAGDHDGQFPLGPGDFTGTSTLSGDNEVAIGTIIPSGDPEPTLASEISTPPNYTIKTCDNTRSGLRIYYPDPGLSADAISFIDSGKWSSSC